MPAREVELDWCMHGVSLKTIREAWNEEYKSEREGNRSTAVSCSCCMGPSYGSWTCPTCSLVEGG